MGVRLPCPALSVVIATFNRPTLLNKTLWSLRRQNFRLFEVIVVNDHGPGTETDEVVASHQDDLSLTYLRLQGEQQRGAAFARNRAFERVASPRILIIDDDCLCLPDLLQQHVGVPRNMGLIGLRYMLHPAVHAAIDPTVPMDYSILPRQPDSRDGLDWLYDPARKHARPTGARLGAYVYTCHFSAPTQNIRKIGGMWEQMIGCGYEDLEFGVRLARSGVALHLDETIRVYHQNHPQIPNLGTCVTNNKALYHETLADPSICARGRPLLPR